MTLELRQRSTLQDIAREAWEPLARAADNFYLSYDWLRLVERDREDDARYMLLYKNEQLIAALPTYLVQRELNPDYEPARLIDGRWQGRYLIAGSRRAYLNDLLLHPDLDKQAREESLVLLSGALQERCLEGKRDAVLFLYLTTPSAALVRQAAPSTCPILMTADAALDLPGTSFEHYLAALSARRRGRVRHEMRTFEQCHYEVAVRRLETCWEEAGRLLGKLQGRYGTYGPDSYWQTMLQQQAEYLDDQGLVFCCSSQGQMVGFSLAYQWQGTLWFRAVGFDYDRLQQGGEYFALVFYQPLIYAYAQGLRRLHFGREAYEAKIGRGARLRPLWGIEMRQGNQAEAADSTWQFNRQTALAWRTRVSPFHQDVLLGEGWQQWGCGAE